jgi:hypothetical protein
MFWKAVCTGGNYGRTCRHFQNHIVELDVRELASDAEIEALGNASRRRCTKKAAAKASKMVRESETIIIMKRFGESPVEARREMGRVIHAVF